jgi:di/tricarboxylate transporter
MHTHGDYTHMAGSGLFMLVVVFLITYLILTFYNPRFVQRKDHGRTNGCRENDQILSMLWALVIAVVILVVLGLIWYAFKSHC